MNLLIIVVIAIVVILILNHFVFQNDIIYDKLIKGQTSSGGAPTSTTTSIMTNTGNDLYFIGETGTFIPDNKIKQVSSSNFMFSVWFYIEDFNSNPNRFKNIASFLSPASSTKMESSLSVVLDKLSNNLIVAIKCANVPELLEYRISNVPLQKWNCLIISVNNRTMDIYLEGKLVNSFVLENYHQGYPHSSIYLGNNGSNYFEGYITRVRFRPNSINPEEAYVIYKEGIDSSIMGDFLNKYRLKVGLYEYDKSVGEFTI